MENETRLKLAGIGLAGLVGVILNMVLFWNSPQADPVLCADEAQI